jgi:hypothetical protein
MEFQLQNVCGLRYYFRRGVGEAKKRRKRVTESLLTKACSWYDRPALSCYP